MYSQYVPKNERPVITAMIDAMLADGHEVSVNDGEEDVIHRSVNATDIRASLGGTGEDRVRFAKIGSKESEGWFWLIYDNGSEGDPMIVIADYTVTPVCEKIWRDLNAKYGE